MRQIAIDEEMFQDLQVLKSALSSNASFKTVLNELLISARAKGDLDELFVHHAKQHLASIKINRFINELIDWQLLDIRAATPVVKGMLLCICMGDIESLYWTVNDLVQQRDSKKKKHKKDAKKLLEEVKKSKKQK